MCLKTWVSKTSPWIDPFISIVCVCVCVSLGDQSRLTLCDPLDCSPPDSLVHGIFQARILEWVAISLFQGILPTQGLSLHLFHCKQIFFYPLNHQGSTTSSFSKELLVRDKRKEAFHLAAKQDTLVSDAKPLNVQCFLELWAEDNPEPSSVLAGKVCHPQWMRVLGQGVCPSPV